jgi:predicted lipid carrier protein YhbT
MLNLPALPQLPLSVQTKALNLMPHFLKPALKMVPFSAQKALLLPALHSIFREALEDGDFEFLANKWLKISITDLEVNWWISFDNKKLIMASPQQNIAEDVSFSATGDDLILIAGRKQDPDTLFFQRKLKIEGDTELGLEVKNLIDAIDIEQLPTTVHLLVDRCASFLQKHRDSCENAA